MNEIGTILAQMNEDMLMRGRAESTKQNYIRYAEKFLTYTKLPVDKIDETHIRIYLHHLLTERNLLPGTVNMYNASIRFLFEVTLDRPLHQKQIPRMREANTLPTILTKEELRRLFEQATPLQNKAMLMTLYGGGLRLSEVCHLRIQDIDSKSMRIFVNCGKGSKDRYTLLSQTNLEILREYWKAYKPRHPEGWLFLNREGDSCAKSRALQRAFHVAMERAEITKPATVHTLRSCFATHLLESGVDFFTVKRLLGHAEMTTTTRYLRVMEFDNSLKSPLDSMPKKRGRKPKTAGACNA